MQVWSLSSGSSGNCYLVREGGSSILLEGGLGVARVEQELERLGLAFSEVAAVVASHEHADHWSSAIALARRMQAPLLCSAGTWDAGGGRSAAVSHVLVAAGRPVSVGPLLVEPFALPHDAREPLGFVIRSRWAAVCLATDMGTATEEVVERARSTDLVILESNHAVEMVARGPYPAALKARILGDRGHLSNEAAARALVSICGGKPRHFWLAHLSRVNNSPRLALSTVREVLRREGLSHVRVSVALRDRRSLFWDSQGDGAPVQLPLFELT